MITIEHLQGFLSMHAGFRAEFGRLAEAARAPRDASHASLVEEQVAVVLDILHAHHTHEDVHVGPFLLQAAPEAAEDLEALEAVHAVLDPLIARASDRTLPLPERAADLAALHAHLNAHLDHEERTAVPLILAHWTPQMMEQDRRQAMQEIGLRRTPVVFGWVYSCLTPAEREAALAAHPAVVRVLHRMFWWPAHQRRMVALYGTAEPALPLPPNLAGAR
jgi:hypothetical protein